MRSSGLLLVFLSSGCATTVSQHLLPPGTPVMVTPDWPDTTPSGPLFVVPRNADGAPDRSAAVRRDQAASDAIAQRGADGGVATELSASALVALETATRAGFDVALSRPIRGAALTFEAFVRGAHGTILSLGQGATRFAIEADGAISVRVSGGVVRTPDDVLDGAWQHLGVTVEGRALTITRNGDVVAQLQLPSPLEIGEVSSARVGGFDGALDEVAIYDLVLAPSELRARRLVAEGFVRPRRAQASLPIEMIPRPAAGDHFVVSMSDSGRFTVVSGAQGTAIVYDAATGQPLRSFAGPRPGVTMGVDIDPSERMLAMTGSYATVHDLETGETLRAFPGGGTQLAFGGGGRWLAVNVGGAMLGGFTAWRLDDGRQIAQHILDPGQMVMALTTSADDDVYLGTSTGRLVVYRIADRDEPIRIADFKTEMRMVKSIDVSPNGELVALAGVGTVEVRRTRTLNLVDAFYDRKISGEGVSFADDGRLVIAQGVTLPALVVSPLTGEVLGELAQVLGPTMVASRGGRVVAATQGADALFALDGALQSSLGVEGAGVAQIAFSADGQMLSMMSRDRRASRFDLALARLDAAVEGTVAALDHDGATVLMREGKRVDLRSGARVAAPAAPPADASLATYPGGLVYVARDLGSAVAAITVLNAKGARRAASVKVTSFLDAVSVDAAGRSALSHGQLVRLESGAARVVDPALISGVLSPDGRRIYASSRKQADPAMLDADGRILWTEPNDWAASTSVFSDDGKLVARAPWYHRTLVIRDAATGRELRRTKLQSLRPAQLRFSPDGRHIAVAAPEGHVELIAVDGSTHHLFMQRDSDWVIVDDAGRFAGSRDAHRMLSAVQGVDVLAVDQVAVARNRPDAILAALPGAAADAISYYKARVDRRQAKLRAIDDVGAPPRARITRTRVEGGTATVDASYTDDTGLRSARVFVNGTPLPPTALEGTSARVEHLVTLVSGPNRIEVAAVDLGGLESSRGLAIVDGPPRAAGRLVYLGLGVSAYDREDLTLGFAHRDAEAIGAALAKLAPYAAVDTTIRTNQEVHRGVLDELMATAAATRPEDTLVLFAAGHGLHDVDAAATYYFLSHEADPARLAETAIPFERFEALLAAAPARRKIFLIDTCESGELEATGLAEESLPPGARSRAARGLKRLAPARPAPRRYVLDRERFIYRDLEQRSGAIVFASSRGDELSYESDELQSGYFTRGLLDALAGKGDDDGDGLVSLEELRGFVSRAVAKRSGDRQHPVIDRENIHQGFALSLTAESSFASKDPLALLPGYWRSSEKETRLANRATGASGPELEKLLTQFGASTWSFAADRVLAPAPGFFHVAERGPNHLLIKVAARNRYAVRLTFAGRDRMCAEYDYQRGRPICYERAPWLGLGFGPAPTPGVIVNDVMEGGPAAVARLRKGDLITALGDTAVSTPDALVAAVARLESSARVAVTFTREGTTRELTLQLAPPVVPAVPSKAERRARIRRISDDDDTLIERVLDAVPRRWRRTFDAILSKGRVDVDVRPSIDMAACRLTVDRTQDTSAGGFSKAQETQLIVDLRQIDPSAVKLDAVPTREGTENDPPVRALMGASYPGDWAVRSFKDGKEDEDNHEFFVELLAEDADDTVLQAFQELLMRCQTR